MHSQSSGKLAILLCDPPCERDLLQANPTLVERRPDGDSRSDLGPPASERDRNLSMEARAEPFSEL